MEKNKAVLYSASRPSDEQFARFERFLEKKYKRRLELEWVESDMFPGGFRLEAEDDVYDWSVGGRFTQLKRKLQGLSGSADNIIRSSVRLSKTGLPKRSPKKRAGCFQ